MSEPKFPYQAPDQEGTAMSNREPTREEREAARLIVVGGDIHAQPCDCEYVNDAIVPPAESGCVRCREWVTDRIARALAARRGGDAATKSESDCSCAPDRVMDYPCPHHGVPHTSFPCPESLRAHNDECRYRHSPDAAPVGTRLAGALHKLTEAEERLVLRAEVTSPGLAVIIRRLEMQLLEVRAALRLWESAAVPVAAPTLAAVEAALRAVPWTCVSCERPCRIEGHNSIPDYPAMARAVLALWAQEAKK